MVVLPGVFAYARRIGLDVAGARLRMLQRRRQQAQYLVLVVLDEPNPERPGLPATAGMNAGPTAGNIIGRIAPMLNVEPRFDDVDLPLMAAY